MTVILYKAHYNACKLGNPLFRSNTILVFKNLGGTLRRAEGALGEDDAKMTWLPVMPHCQGT